MKLDARPCAKCGQVFSQTTARVVYGRGRRLWRSKWCSTECREVARIGRIAYQRRAVVGAAEEAQRT